MLLATAYLARTVTALACAPGQVVTTTGACAGCPPGQASPDATFCYWCNDNSGEWAEAAEPCRCSCHYGGLLRGNAAQQHTPSN
jgi:hypothetical protein